jgi:feruloyl esterase
MKKTHDAAMVILERMYGERPRFNYYIGNSQGGREALTVAQRYSADYDGILATVPVVSLSSLQLAPRIGGKPQANWSAAKVNAVRGSSCASATNWMADRRDHQQPSALKRIFDVSEGAPNRQPWAE